MMDQLGGRKFVFAILVTILSFILVLVGKLTSDSFVSFVEIIGGIYVIGNVGATIATGMMNSATPPELKP